VERYRDQLDTGKGVVALADDQAAYDFSNKWKPFEHKSWEEKSDTRVALSKLQALAQSLDQLPEGFVVQPQVKKMLEARQKMTAGVLSVNWGYAEILSYATLLEEGYPIRLCGQDAARGTFAHRHAVLHDQNTDAVYIPLSHLSPNQVQINIVDSLLSEEAVLAFEYGFAAAEPNNLVIWEAQFGDFANGAQVVIDQFLSSGEQKWGRLCGLILFLPHGYEGQGPEHSSARLERYLQLCAQQNMQVCIPTTPAQIFHLLRRQMIRPYRKPLIVMTPKSLLRHPLAVSTLDELAHSEFQLVLPEVEDIDPRKVKRLIFCTGKVYYDLLEERKAQSCVDVAIIRLEQLYPFPEAVIAEQLKSYKKVLDMVWCQEEPENQGSWFFIQRYLSLCLAKNQHLRYVGRPASASPAVGYHSVHEKEQKALIRQALLREE
jgi:2-oxoglutarate dehydrogenase E1 component